MSAARKASGGYSGDGIREIRPGVWELRVSLGVDPVRTTPDGSPVYRRKSVQFAGTKTEARAERRRLLDELIEVPTPRGYTFRRQFDRWLDTAVGFDLSARLALIEEVVARLDPETNHTFAELFERWLSTASDLEASTVQAHRMLYNRHIGPAIGEDKLRELRTQQIEAFYAALHRPKPAGAGLHPRSIRRVHAIINTALKRAMAWEWLDRNPAEFAKPPRVHGRPDTYTPTLVELQRALAAALEVGPWALAFIWTAAATGMRRGELCGLQWADIDGQAQAIHVRRAIVDVGGKAVEKTPKTGKGRRVEIPAELVAALAAYQVTISEDAGPWMWTMNGQRVHPDKLTDTWNTVKARAEIPKECRLHDLRHAYGTVLAEHGGERIVAAVADQLGHSDMTTTMRNYLASVATGRRRAADLMGQLLAGTPQT